MERNLVVRVGGTGLDWDSELIELLDAATSLSWGRDRAREEVETGPAQGLGEIILTAVVTTGVNSVVGTTLDALLAEARTAIGEWRKRRLDPPDVSVDTQPDEDSGTAE